MVNVRDRDKGIITPANSDLACFDPPYGDSRELGFVLPKGEIQPGTDRTSVWEFGVIRFPYQRCFDVVIYFVCPRCGRISADTEVSSYPQNCLMCDKCSRHLWLRYEGYSSEGLEEFRKKAKEGR